MSPSVVSCPFLACFQSVVPVLSLLGCRVVRCAAGADRRHLCWYGTIVVVVLKWSWGIESIWMQYTSHSCQYGAEQEQQNNLQTWLVPDKGGQVWRGTAWECRFREEAAVGVWKTWEDGLKNSSDRAEAVWDELLSLNWKWEIIFASWLSLGIQLNTQVIIRFDFHIE